MAQGTFTFFDNFKARLGEKEHDLGADAFKLMLIDNTKVATAADNPADSSAYTEVASGTSYPAGGVALTTTYTESAGVATFDIANVSIAQDATGATNIYQAIVYNSSDTGTEDAIGFIDMTADGGVTPVSLQPAPINLSFNAAGLFDLT